MDLNGVSEEKPLEAHTSSVVFPQIGETHATETVTAEQAYASTDNDNGEVMDPREENSSNSFHSCASHSSPISDASDKMGANMVSREEYQQQVMKIMELQGTIKTLAQQMHELTQANSIRIAELQEVIQNLTGQLTELTHVNQIKSKKEAKKITAKSKPKVEKSHKRKPEVDPRLTEKTLKLPAFNASFADNSNDEVPRSTTTEVREGLGGNAEAPFISKASQLPISPVTVAIQILPPSPQQTTVRVMASRGRPLLDGNEVNYHLTTQQARNDRISKVRKKINGKQGRKKKGKMYPCGKCNKTFATYQAKFVHIRSIHDGRRWICRYCGNSYKYPGGCRNHEIYCHNLHPPSDQ